MRAAIRAVLAVLMFSVAAVLTVVLCLRVLVNVLDDGDQNAWRNLTAYAVGEGPQIEGGGAILNPPCTGGSEDESSDDGSGEITMARHVDDRAIAKRLGRAAKSVLMADGWVDDGEGTAAEKTYFSGTKVIAGREVFVAVEWWEADLGDPPEFVIRYLQDAYACGGIFWGPF